MNRLSLKGRALRLLAQREHSRCELHTKLARYVQDEAEAASLPTLLDTLEAQGWISAERVAESVLRQRSPRWGNQRVLQELRRKGLEPDLIRDCATQLADTELERAQAIWVRRFGQPPETPQERARQMRFFASRGFAAGTVGQLLRWARQQQQEG